MITKEKHFTKCETPNSSRIVEDKRHTSKMSAAAVEMVNGQKSNQTMATMDGTKAETVDNKAPVPETPKAVPDDKQQAPRDSGADDAASTVGGQKVGTVIPNRIFVGGFAPKTIDEDLWKFFSTIANITAAKIIYDRSGVSKCYGFVTFANPKDAKQIVKQTGGAMLSPMGRLRISQAVRKQVPHYPSEFTQVPVSTSIPVAADGYYINPSCPSKPSVCLAYPVQAVQPVHHVSTIQHMPTGPQQQANMSAMQNQPQQANGQALPQHRPRSAPSTSPRSSTAGSSESGTHNGHPPNIHNYHDNIYPGTMVTGPPTYVIPSMGIPYAPSLPAYDATGLYTTCPGYAQPMAYPYAVVLPPPREGAPAYAPSYGHGPITYMPQPPAACYVRDASGKAPTHLPIMNSYIY